MLIEILPRIIELYFKQEYSIKQVAITLGTSETSTQRILKKAGYKLRSPSEATKLAFNKGRAIRNHSPKTLEHKRKLSVAQTQYLFEHDHQFLGRHHSTATKTKLKRRQVSLETRVKLSASCKDRPSSMLGKHHSEESKTKMSQTRKKMYENPTFRAEMLKVLKEWSSRPEVIEKRKLAMARRVRDPIELSKMLSSRRPTDLEAKLLAVIEKYHLPYKYTGDGSFLIGRLNPDFVNTNSEKIAIEVFGGHWHQDKTDSIRSEDGRRKILREYGWELVVIWGDELKSMLEEAIVEKIRWPWKK